MSRDPVPILDQQRLPIHETSELFDGNTLELESFRFVQVGARKPIQFRELFGAPESLIARLARRQMLISREHLLDGHSPPIVRVQFLFAQMTWHLPLPISLIM